MKKRVFAAATAAMMTVSALGSVTVGAFEQTSYAEDVSVYVNGQKIDNGQYKPIIVNDRTLVRIVPIFDALDFEHSEMDEYKSVNFVRKGTKINPFIAGGTGSDSLNLNMPKTIPAMLEPASPNIVAVAGMEAALDETIGRISDFEAKEKELTEHLVKGLEKIENVTTYLPLEDSHIGIVAFNIEGYKAEDVGTILDQDYHIAVRTGYHCAPLIHKHLIDIEKGGVVRASVGRYTTRNDIEKLLEAVEELSEEM